MNENIEQNKEKDEFPEDSPQADYKKGKEFYDKGDFVQAAAFFHNALIGFEQENDDKGIANAADQLGDVCVQREEHATAIKHFERSQAICRKLDDPFSLLALKKKIAASQRASGQFPDALKNYMDVLDIYSGYNNPAGAVTVLEEIAKLYEEMGEPAKAGDTYRTVASIHKNFKHERYAAKFIEKAESIEQAAN